MKKNNDLKFLIDNYKFQYLFLAICCFILFAILFFGSDKSYENIQAPVGKYQNNIWAHTDFESYYDPAVNYLEYGTFGKEHIPDALRTVGYPFFIAIMIKIFGDNWIYWMYVFNCLTLPLIFIALYYISNALFDRKVARMVLVSSFILGVYMGRVIFIGTDFIFFLFFITGIYFLVKYFSESRKLFHLIFYLIFIALAAEMRPTLIYFAVVHIGLFFFLNNKFNIFPTVKSKLIVLSGTFLVILFSTSLPSIRNYNNYGFFKPSVVLEINLFEYLAKKTLYKENLSNKYDSLNKIVNAEPSHQGRMVLQKKFTKETVKSYPKSFVKVIIENLQNVLLDNGITNQIGNYFGLNWKKTERYAASKFLYLTYFMYMLIYIFIYGLFIIKLLQMLKNREWYPLIFLFLLISTMLFPTFIAGSGGSRLRIGAEWIILIYACACLNSYIGYFKNRKRVKAQ